MTPNLRCSTTSNHNCYSHPQNVPFPHSLLCKTTYSLSLHMIANHLPTLLKLQQLQLLYAPPKCMFQHIFNTLQPKRHPFPQALLCKTSYSPSLHMTTKHLPTLHNHQHSQLLNFMERLHSAKMCPKTMSRSSPKKAPAPWPANLQGKFLNVNEPATLSTFLWRHVFNLHITKKMPWTMPSSLPWIPHPLYTTAFIPIPIHSLCICHWLIWKDLQCFQLPIVWIRMLVSGAQIAPPPRRCATSL